MPNQNTSYLKIRIRITKICLAQSKIPSYLPNTGSNSGGGRIKKILQHQRSWRSKKLVYQINDLITLFTPQILKYISCSPDFVRWDTFCSFKTLGISSFQNHFRVAWDSCKINHFYSNLLGTGKRWVSYGLYLLHIEIKWVRRFRSGLAFNCCTWAILCAQSCALTCCFCCLDCLGHIQYYKS